MTNLIVLHSVFLNNECWCSTRYNYDQFCIIHVKSKAAMPHVNVGSFAYVLGTQRSTPFSLSKKKKRIPNHCWTHWSVWLSAVERSAVYICKKWSSLASFTINWIYCNCLQLLQITATHSTSLLCNYNIICHAPKDILLTILNLFQ